MTVTIRVIDLNDARERSRADDYVRAAEGGTPFHRPAWSIAVARGCGQKDHYLGAERGGVLVGVLPLTEVRSRLFGNALVSAGFAVGGGALADDDATADALVAAGWSVRETLGCASMELRGGRIPADWTVDAETYVGFARPLAADEAAELLAIPKRQRAEIRKAIAGPLTVSVGRDAAALAAHYAVYAESVRNLGTPVFPARLFREMLAAFGEDADIQNVWYEGNAVSTSLTLYFRETAYPYWGGGTREARSLRANDRGQFALMSHARSRGCTRFDFGRSKTGSGPALWKKTWGFEPEPLMIGKRAIDGSETRAINPHDPRYRLQVAAWKKMPIWAARLIGPSIARGLG